MVLFRESTSSAADQHHMLASLRPKNGGSCTTNAFAQLLHKPWSPAHSCQAGQDSTMLLQARLALSAVSHRVSMFHPYQGSTKTLQEPRQGSQSMMQAHNN